MIEIRLPLGGELAFDAAWLAPDEATRIEQDILGEIELRQESIVLFGREIPQPRKSLWMGDVAYRYSGRTFEPAPWTAAVRALRARVEEAARHAFNSVLVNLYRDGRDSMGMHADDEPELGERPVIASASFGATRRFVLKPKKKGAAERREIPLGHGSLLVMRGETQARWLHGVPKEPRVTTPRLNLTFRQIAPA